MVKSGIRAALQESIPIGYRPARAKYIHDRGCQVGGRTSLKKLQNKAPHTLKKMSRNIMKHYGKQSKETKKTVKARTVLEKKTAKTKKTASNVKKKGRSKKGRSKKGGGTMTQTILSSLTKPALSAVIILLVLNQLANNYPKYKRKAGGGKKKDNVECYKKILTGLKKDTLQQIAGTLMTAVPMNPSDSRYSQLTSIVNTQGGFLPKNININNLSVVTLIFLLQQIIDKKWKKQRGGGCGCGGPSNKTLLSEIDRITKAMHGGSYIGAPRSDVYNQTQTGCIQPDWCAQCI